MLRCYQQNVYNKIFDSDCNTVAVLPTGAGKSHIFGELIKNYYEFGKRVTFVAHRKELLNQAFYHLVNHGIPTYEIGQIRGEKGYPLRPSCPIQIASVDTMRSRKYYPHSDYYSHLAPDETKFQTVFIKPGIK